VHAREEGVGGARGAGHGQDGAVGGPTDRSALVEAPGGEYERKKRCTYKGTDTRVRWGRGGGVS